MSDWIILRLSELLTESKIIENNPDPDRKIRVRLNCKGVEKRPLKSEKEGATKNYTRKAGQFIYGKQNFHKGAFGVIPVELDGFSSSGDLPAFDVDSRCSPEWIDYWLKTDNRYLRLAKHAKGVGSQRVNVDLFLQETIALPSLKLQTKIINNINKSCLTLEILNVENKNQSTYLTKLRQAILQEAIEGKLTADWRKENPVRKGDPDFDSEALLEKIQAEKQIMFTKGLIKQEKPLLPIDQKEIPFILPEGWVWSRMGVILKNPPRNGYSPKEVNYETKVKSLKLGATTWGVFNPLERKFIDEDIPVDSVFWLKPNDILIQRSNSIDYVGVTAIYTGKENEFIYPDLMMKLEIIEPISVLYSHKVLSAPFCREYFRKNAKGAQKSMPKINQGVVNNTLIPIPPLAEQQAIVDRVEKLLSMVDELEKQVSERKEQSEQLMQAVLREAFEGG